LQKKEDINLSSATLFYYEIYESEFDQSDKGKVKRWSPIQCEHSFPTDVLVPLEKVLAGFDVVEYVCRNSPECSLLSCSDLSKEFTVNAHCLFNTLEESKQSVESGKFHACEPGPYRIIAVYMFR